MRLTDEQLQIWADFTNKSFIRLVTPQDVEALAAELIEARREITALKSRCDECRESAKPLVSGSVERIAALEAEKSDLLVHYGIVEQALATQRKMTANAQAERDELRAEVERLRKELVKANNGYDDRAARLVRILRGGDEEGGRDDG